MRNFSFGLILTLISLPAFAGNVSVTDAWLRLLPGDLPLAGYAHVANDTGYALTLIAASSPEFSAVQLHRSMTHEGMDSMMHVDAISIAIGQSLDFAPGGYHLMLLGRKHLLHIGQMVPVTLKFKDGTQVTVEFMVKGATRE